MKKICTINGKPASKKQFALTKKQIKANRKKRVDLLKSTADWVDVSGVSNNYITLRRDKASAFVAGVEIQAPDIFLLPSEDQGFVISGLRQAFNVCPEEMRFFFVPSQTGLTDIEARVAAGLPRAQELGMAGTASVLRMIADKTVEFKKITQEMHFYITLQSGSLEKLKEEMGKLIGALKQYHSVSVRDMNRLDYYNLIRHLYQQDVADALFCTGMYAMSSREVSDSLFNSSPSISNAIDPFAHYDTSAYFLGGSADEDFIKRRIAPRTLYFDRNHCRIGNAYTRLFLVTKLPHRFHEGILSGIVTPGGNVGMHILAKYFPMANTIMWRQLSALRGEMNNSKEESVVRMLGNEINTLSRFINNHIARNDRFWNCMIVFAVRGKDKASLENACSSLMDRLLNMEIECSPLNILEEWYFKMMSGLYVDDGMGTLIKNAPGIPMSSEGLAGLYPFVFSALRDRNGMMLGYDRVSHGPVVFNPNLIFDDPQKAREAGRNNANTLVFGSSGSGKSVTLALLLEHAISSGYIAITIDPENKNKKFVQKFGGQYINLGATGGRYIINPFDLMANSNDDGDEEEFTGEDMEHMYSIESSIRAASMRIKMLFKFLFPSLTDDEGALVAQIATMCYKSKINCDAADLRSLDKGDMPTFDDFVETADKMLENASNSGNRTEKDALSSVRIKACSMITEYRDYFCGTTNITVPGEGVLAFGTHAMYGLSKEVQAALNYTMNQYVMSLALDPDKRTVTLYDEAHIYLRNPSISEFIEQLSRRSRKYMNALIIATQEPNDLDNDTGKAIINGCTNLVVMRMPIRSVTLMSKMIELTSTEKEMVPALLTGDAVLICGATRLQMKVFATDEEIANTK